MADLCGYHEPEYSYGRMILKGKNQYEHIEGNDKEQGQRKEHFPRDQ